MYNTIFIQQLATKISSVPTDKFISWWNKYCYTVGYILKMNCIPLKKNPTDIELFYSFAMSQTAVEFLKYDVSYEMSYRYNFYQEANKGMNNIIYLYAVEFSKTLKYDIAYIIAWWNKNYLMIQSLTGIPSCKYTLSSITNETIIKIICEAITAILKNNNLY